MDTRTWPDEQLHEAVASSTTWKGVAAAIGLAQSSTPRLRRHADRLGLDTSHFVGKRRWSDGDLRRIVAECSTWGEVLGELGVSDCGETRRYVKGHAVRLGLDVSKLDGRARTAELDDLQGRQPDILRQLRVAAEAIAMVWFMVRGIPVSVPAQPCEYDLLVALESGVRRIQVKSSSRRGRHGTWAVDIGRRPYSVDKCAGKVPYDPDELDYFFIVDGDGLLYLIPSGVLAGRVGVNVGRYAAYCVGSASSMLDASSARDASAA